MKILVCKLRYLRPVVVDLVYLKLCPDCMKMLAKKLNEVRTLKHFDSCEILERISAVVYKVKFPEYCVVHSVFHVSQQKKTSEILQRTGVCPRGWSGILKVQSSPGGTEVLVKLRVVL